MLKKFVLPLTLLVCFCTIFSTLYIPYTASAAIVAAPEPPELISPSQVYVTADTTPALLFRAAPSTTIVVVTTEDDLIGTGFGHGSGITVIEPNAPMSPGLHQLYAYTYNTQQPSLQSAAVALAPIFVTGSENVNVTIADIVPLLSTLNGGHITELMERIRPLHRPSDVDLSEQSWMYAVNDNDAMNVTFALFDSYGYPIVGANNSDFQLDAVGEGPVDIQEIQEGIYQFVYYPEAAFEHVTLYYRGMWIGSASFGEPAPYITFVPPLFTNVAVGASYSLPESVTALLSNGGSTQVPVVWNNPQYNVEQPGTYHMTGAAEGYTGGVELTLTVTSEDHYRIVLTWGATPFDLDSHLFGTIDEQQSFHIWYANMEHTVTDVTYARLEHDSTNGYGPETTNILVNGNVSTFRFNVHQYSEQHQLMYSNAKVILYKGDQELLNVDVPQGAGDERYWNVFQMVGGTVYTVNALQAQGNPQWEASINRVTAMIHALPEPHLVTTGHADHITAIRNDITNGMEVHIVNYYKLIQAEMALVSQGI